jgi:Lysyl oxidase
LLRRFAVLLLVPAVLLPSAAGSMKASRELLPDLVTWPPGRIFLQVTGRGKRLVRFSNEVVNAGAGPLELHPRFGDCNRDGDFGNDRTAYQRIYRDANGDGRFTRSVDVRFRTRTAGCTRFHPAHKHWHFDGFAGYSLRPRLGSVATTGKKVSVCAVDSKRRLPKPGSPPRRYYGSGVRRCRRDSIGGISIGWGDIYGARVSGQELDVTTLADGVYCLVSRADPDNRLEESNERDNTGTTRIVLRGNALAWRPYRRC